MIGLVGLHRSDHAANYGLEAFMDETYQLQLGRLAVQQALRLFAAKEPGRPVDSMVHGRDTLGADMLLSAGFCERSPRRHFVCETPADAGASGAGANAQVSRRRVPLEREREGGLIFLGEVAFCIMKIGSFIV